MGNQIDRNKITWLAKALEPFMLQQLKNQAEVTSLDLSKILLISSGSVTEYASTDAGLTSALSAAISGDIVLWRGTITGNHTVPNGVELRGWAAEISTLSGTTTLGSSAILSNCTITGTISGSGYVFNVNYAGHYVVYGYSNTLGATGYDTIVYGNSNTTSQLRTGGLFGYEHNLGQVQSAYAFGGGIADPATSIFQDGFIALTDVYRAQAGDSQVRMMAGSDTITSITSSWLSSVRKYIPTDTAWSGVIYITVVEDGVANVWSYQIVFVAENDGGTTSILSSTVTALYEDIATWDCQLVADDTNDRLIIQFTDSASTALTNAGVTTLWLISETTQPA